MAAGENLGGQFSPITPIRREDLSSGDARRSRAVSATEFHRIAAQGASRYAELSRTQAPPTDMKLDQHFDRISRRAYKAAKEPWGGVTVNSRTGRSVRQGADKYALTVRPQGVESVSVPANADRATFHGAMQEARQRYGDVLNRDQHHLGVFHDADKGTIDIDPVLVVKKREDAESIGAYTHNVGGAFHFKTGDGFWPPHVKFGEPERAATQTRPNPKPFDPAKGKDRMAPVSTSAHPAARFGDLRRQLKK